MTSFWVKMSKEENSATLRLGLTAMVLAEWTETYETDAVSRRQTGDWSGKNKMHARARESEPTPYVLVIKC